MSKQLIDFTGAVECLNRPNVAMDRTHLYRYLRLGGYCDNSLTCLSNYLRSLGYIKGTDSLDETTYRTLKYILEAYYRNEVRKAN